MGRTGKLAIAYRYIGTVPVHIARTGEGPHEVRATVQASTGYFPVGTVLRIGDVVEFRRTRQSSFERKTITSVNATDGAVVATWTTMTEPEASHAEALRAVRSLHPLVVSAAATLFSDGHYGNAVFEGMKLVEARVRDLSGLDKSGRDLMATALSGTAPLIDVRRHRGRSGEAEQEGLKFIAMGATQAIRNPLGHEIVEFGDPREALEHLAVASLLMRRLDRQTMSPRSASARVNSDLGVSGRGEEDGFATST